MLADSLARHEPGSRLIAAVVDDVDGLVDAEAEPFDVFDGSALGDEALDARAARGPAALLALARPLLMTRLMARHAGAPLAYFAPSVEVLGPLRWPELVEDAIAAGPDRSPVTAAVVVAGPRAQPAVDAWARRAARGLEETGRTQVLPGVVRVPGTRLDGRPARPKLASRAVCAVTFDEPVPGDAPDASRDRTAASLIASHTRSLALRGHGQLRHLACGRGPLSEQTQLAGILRGLLPEALAQGAISAPPSTDAFLDQLLDWAAGPSEALGDSGVSRVLHAVWLTRADLQAAYPDPGGADAEGLLGWTRLSGRREVGLPERLVPSDGPARSTAAEPTTIAMNGARPSAATTRVAVPAGVNVVGLLRSGIGLGEGARLLIKALDARAVKLLPVDATACSGAEVHLEYAAVDAAAATLPINIVCLNGDVVPAFAASVGSEFFTRYSIAMMAWELAELPEEWLGVLGLFDELWVNTAETAPAFARAAGLPVRHQRLPVHVPRAGIPARPANVPRDHWLFLTLFDYNSTIARKNPLGAIAAFTAAFGPDDPATLLIKTINAADRPRDATRVALAASTHPNIVVMDGFVPEAEKHALMLGCDCYVSLHRAEGFGIPLAEAVSLGKPVIATGYGGSLDFLSPDDCYLVRHTITTVGEDASHYPPSGVWAEPDVEHAASLMREVFDDRAAATERGRRAALRIATTHSLDAVGRVVERRLGEIQWELNAAGPVTAWRGDAADPPGGEPAPDVGTQLAAIGRALARIERRIDGLSADQLAERLAAERLRAAAS